MRPGAVRVLFLCCWLAANLLCGCDYARMKDDDALDTYQSTFPDPPKGTIPMNGGLEVIRNADPKELQNPLGADPKAVDRGKLAYGYYCVHCHGPELDGYGTVGQSFTPVPTNLRDPRVQGQSDGDLYQKIRLGFRRHPPLAETTNAPDTWAIIRYLRAPVRPGKG